MNWFDPIQKKYVSNDGSVAKKNAEILKVKPKNKSILQMLKTMALENRSLKVFVKDLIEGQDPIDGEVILYYDKSIEALKKDHQSLLKNVESQQHIIEEQQKTINLMQKSIKKLEQKQFIGEKAIPADVSLDHLVNQKASETKSDKKLGLLALLAGENKQLRVNMTQEKIKV